MRIMVTGSRHWTDVDAIASALMQAFNELAKSADEPAPILIHGDCAGADSIAARVARRVGWEVIPYPPNKHVHGVPNCYYIRNQAMVDSRPDVCIAFPMRGSKGTWDAVRRARAASIPVVIVRFPRS